MSGLGKSVIPKLPARHGEYVRSFDGLRCTVIKRVVDLRGNEEWLTIEDEDGRRLPVLLSEVREA